MSEEKKDTAARKKPKQKKSLFPFIFMFLVIAVAGTVGSNFAGPYKGWLDNFLNKEVRTIPEPPGRIDKEPVDVVKEEPDSEPEEDISPDPEPEDNGKAVLVEIPRTDTEILYDELLSKYKNRYKTPVVGKKYKVRLRSRKTVEGLLEEATEGKIALKLKYGTMTYYIQNVHPVSYPRLFPERAAKMMALAELKRKMDSGAAGTDAPLEVAEPVSKQVFTSFLQEGGDLRFDPSFGPSPEDLKPLMKDFGVWMNYQRQRMGGPMALKIYSKKHGRRTVVLYMQSSKLYRLQEYDVRYGVTEGIWRIWSLKCLERGYVNDVEKAYLCIVDKEGKIIGGSSEKKGSDIWVKKK